MRACTQPSPKWPYDQAVEAVLRIRSSNSRRYAPSWSGGTAASSQPGQAGAPAGVRPPSPAPSSRMRHSARAAGAGHDQRVEAAGVGDQLLRRRHAPRPRSSPRGLDEQPAAAARQIRHRRGAAARPDDLDEPGVHAFERHRPVRQQRRDRVGGRRHVGVAEHGQGDRGWRRRRAAPSRRAPRARVPSVPTRKLGQVDAVLGQQMLERVAGHLPGEAAELGADHGEVRRDTQQSRRAAALRALPPSRPSRRADRSPPAVTTSRATTLSAVRPYAQRP